MNHVVVEGAIRFKRSDASTQLPVKGKGDEGGRRFIEPDRTWEGGPRRTEFGCNGSARQCGEKPPSGLMFSVLRRLSYFRKGHRCVTGDATLVADRVAGVAFSLSGASGSDRILLRFLLAPERSLVGGTRWPVIYLRFSTT